MILVTTLPARRCTDPAVPSNGGSVPGEDQAAPGDDPDGQTQPAESRKQPPSDGIIISLSHCQLHVAGTSQTLLLCFPGVHPLPYRLTPLLSVDAIL